jgi:hypothetical protein
MTSSSASDHVNPAGISALMQKETTSKGVEANKNFGKWLSCGIQISGTFGLHHVEHRWNEIDRGKPNYTGKNMSQCHFVHHKSRID